MQDLKLEKYLINAIDPHLNFVFKVHTKGLQDQEKILNDNTKIWVTASLVEKIVFIKKSSKMT